MGAWDKRRVKRCHLLRTRIGQSRCKDCGKQQGRNRGSGRVSEGTGWAGGAPWASTQPEESWELPGSPVPSCSHCEGGSQAKQPSPVLALRVYQFHAPTSLSLYPSVHPFPLLPLYPARHSCDTCQDLHQLP